MSKWMLVDDELVDLSTFNNLYKVDPIPMDPIRCTYNIVFVDTYKEMDNEFQMIWHSADERDLWFNRIYRFLCNEFLSNSGLKLS